MLKAIQLTLLLSLLVSTHSFANSSFASSKIKKIILHDWGDVLIELSDGLKTAEVCESKSYLVLTPCNPFFDERYRAILAAFHSGTSIGGWVSGCNSRINTPILTRLDLTK